MSRAVIIAVCIAWAAAALAFAYLCCAGASREALGVLGCFTPLIAWCAYETGRAAR